MKLKVINDPASPGSLVVTESGEIIEGIVRVDITYQIDTDPGYYGVAITFKDIGLELGRKDDYVYPSLEEIMTAAQVTQGWIDETA